MNEEVLVWTRVTCPDASCKTLATVVGDGERLIVTVDRNDRRYQPEDFV